MNEVILRAEEGSYPGWPIVIYYHHVHPTIDHYTSLTPEYFEKSLEITLDEIGETLDPHKLNNVKGLDSIKYPRVLITFDDGYKDNIEYAYPILEKYKIRALFFVCPSKVEETPNHNPRENYMNWSDLKFLKSKGHMIGAHTMSHKKLNECSIDEMHYEVDQSIYEVKQNLNQEEIYFAYPYGLIPEKRLFAKSKTLAFGTVKSKAQPWIKQPLQIRRTYYPSNNTSSWRYLAKGWRDQWEKYQ